MGDLALILLIHQPKYFLEVTVPEAYFLILQNSAQLIQIQLIVTIFVIEPEDLAEVFVYLRDHVFYLVQSLAVGSNCLFNLVVYLFVETLLVLLILFSL